MHAVIFLICVGLLFGYFNLAIAISDSPSKTTRAFGKFLGYTILWTFVIGGFFAGPFFWLVWLIGGFLSHFLIEVEV